jgi:hypothetical protein
VPARAAVEAELGSGDGEHDEADRGEREQVHHPDQLVLVWVEAAQSRGA